MYAILASTKKMPTQDFFAVLRCKYKDHFARIVQKEDLYYWEKVNIQLIATPVFLFITAPSFSQYKYYSRFITEHSLA